MRKGIVFSVLIVLLWSCVSSIEKKALPLWNKPLQERIHLTSKAKADFKYNVVSHLKKNEDRRFFKEIDSSYVMNLKPVFLKELNSNLIVAGEETADSRFYIEIEKFDFSEHRYKQPISSGSGCGGYSGKVSSLEIHLLGSIIDNQTQQKKEIKLDEKHETLIDHTIIMNNYFTTERKSKINVDIRVNNMIVDFSNKCSEFIKNAN